MDDRWGVTRPLRGGPFRSSIAVVGGLWLIWRHGEERAERDLAIKTAALLPLIAWTPFFPALAAPGTGVEDEPGHLPRIAGVPANLVPAALVPAIAWLGYLLHRRGL